jgi:hypothetical protein
MLHYDPLTAGFCEKLFAFLSEIPKRKKEKTTQKQAVS